MLSGIVMQLVKASIEDYAEKYTGNVERVFEDLRMETYAKCDNPGMQVGKVEGSFLRMMVALSKARNVLEIGTFTGYSALMMAAALPKDGDLITLEADETHARIAQRYFDKVDFGSKITIVQGDARKTLDCVDGPIDIAFIDADKSSYDHYYEKVLKVLKPGGLMIFDNMLWKGEVLDPKGKDARAIHALNRKLAKDERVDNVLLTVRDGIMLARKRPLA
jgi:caffeoyl-CoA O-methyltransferase